MKFFICEHCKNLIFFIENVGVPVMCCGQKMTELIPDTVEASHEKHIPKVTKNDSLVEVIVGEVQHPMMEEHYIQMIVLETSKGVQIRKLKSTDSVKVAFSLTNEEEFIAAYSYCNLHGLWKTETCL